MRVIVTGGSGFIGSHLVEHLSARGHEVINIDIKAPDGPPTPGTDWHNCSIMNIDGLQRVFRDVQPTHVVHLAALASMEAHSPEEFNVNTQGTGNVLAAVQSVASVERLIITSTQHVRKPGSGLASSDTDFCPYMQYGASKVVTEQLTRQAKLDSAWTIIRPTAVWGPRHLSLAAGLWKLMSRSRYFHPASDPVIRSYGYVKNVAWQIESLLRAERLKVDRKVFYAADGNIRQLDWVNAVCRELTGRDVRTLPLSLIRGLAKIGDAVHAVGLAFPIYGARFENLTTNNPVPVEPTLELLGVPPVSLHEGARETAEWLLNHYRKGTH